MIFDLLLHQPTVLEREKTTGVIRQFDPAFSRAEILSGTGSPDAPFIITIGDQRIALSAHATPHPDDMALEASLRGAHYGQALKTLARQHGGFIRAEWLSPETIDLSAMVMLAGVVGALCTPDALVIAHTAAHASLPAQALLPEPLNGERLPTLRSFPLGLLFTGFIKYEIEGCEGVWMATHNAALLGLPEFAMHTPDHSWGETVLDIFDRLQRYALENSVTFAAGDTVSLGDELTLRFADPATPLEFITADRSWLIVEVI